MIRDDYYYGLHFKIKPMATAPCAPRGAARHAATRHLHQVTPVNLSSLLGFQKCLKPSLELLIAGRWCHHDRLICHQPRINTAILYAFSLRWRWLKASFSHILIFSRARSPPRRVDAWRAITMDGFITAEFMLISTLGAIILNDYYTSPRVEENYYCAVSSFSPRPLPLWYCVAGDAPARAGFDEYISFADYSTCAASHIMLLVETRFIEEWSWPRGTRLKIAYLYHASMWILSAFSLGWRSGAEIPASPRYFRRGFTRDAMSPVIMPQGLHAWYIVIYATVPRIRPF